MTFSLVAFGLVLFAVGAPTAEEVVRDEECGVQVELPAGWSLHPASTLRGGVLVKIYSPGNPPTTRFTLIHAPEGLAGGDLATRARQLATQLQTEIPVESATFAGAKADRIQYETGGLRTSNTD